MKHLIVCREYPPAPSGGIGTYVAHLVRLLVERGETVHVIGQLWPGAAIATEELCQGRLVIHRLPYEEPSMWFGPRCSRSMTAPLARELYTSAYPPQSFSWQASLLAERLVEQENIDVIEGQDYEAPLYFLQLRRALGLGPKKHPPCIVHLHSPTRLIGRYNQWDMTLPRWRIADGMESYSIAAADRLLCPSQFLARQAASEFALGVGAVDVIPYPLGDGVVVERRREVWSQGTICYVGRLERRKGILEWIEAAVALARQYRGARFEFIGANVIGANRLLSEQWLDRAIPRAVKSQFTFHGEVARAAMPALLARARLAVVPSRWDNFPNTCMEAMQCGLPVLTTGAGGMVEMVTDGQTGWLAQAASAAGLREALRRFLAASPDRLAAMGRQAAQAIARLCDGETIAGRHLSLRSCLAAQGAQDHALQSLTVGRDHRIDGAARRAAAAAVNGADAERLCLTRSREIIGATEDKSFFATSLRRQISTPQEHLATARCIVVNPRLAWRLLRRAAGSFSRPRTGDA